MAVVHIPRISTPAHSQHPIDFPYPPHRLQMDHVNKHNCHQQHWANCTHL